MSEHDCVSGWWRGQSSPSTRARTELFTWYSVKSDGNRNIYDIITVIQVRLRHLVSTELRYCMSGSYVVHSSAVWTSLCSWWVVFHAAPGHSWTPRSSRCVGTDLSAAPVLWRKHRYGGYEPQRLLDAQLLLLWMRILQKMRETTKNSGWKKLYKKLNIIKTSVKYTNVSTFCFDTFYNLKVNKTDTFLTEVINDSDS